MITTDYITPTKENPIFRAICSDFGYIEDNQYKKYETLSRIGNTFHIYFDKAIEKLFGFIREYKGNYVIKNNTKFEIEMIWGEEDKYQNILYKKVFSISGKQLKLTKII